MPAPTANACTAPTPTRPIASIGPWIPSLLPPPPALAAKLIIGVGHSAWWQIVAVLASTPAYSHRSLPPSPLGRMAQPRLVHNTRPRPNSSTVSLHPGLQRSLPSTPA